MRWNPWPVGIYKQNGSWGLITAISSTERDFVSANKGSLNELYKNSTKMGYRIGAKQISFAGILPGVFHKFNISDSLVEVSVTTSAVQKALNQLIETNKTVNYENLIILGHKGFVGSNLVEKLLKNDQYFDEESIYKIDHDNKESFPNHLRGSQTILLNLTRKSVLMEYEALLWRELTILNEVYPPPSHNELKKLKDKCGDIYHIVGLKGKSYPSFPKDYKGGVPCCAGWDSEDMEVIIRRMN